MSRITRHVSSSLGQVGEHVGYRVCPRTHVSPTLVQVGDGWNLCPKTW